MTTADPLLLRRMLLDPDVSLAGESPETYRPEPFPIEALPPSIRAFVATGAAARGVPNDFVAVPLLAYAGAVMGDRLALRIKKGWEEYGAVWVVVVGRPGTGKSPAQRYASLPLRAIQQLLYDAWTKAMAEYEELPAELRRGTPPPKLASVFTTDATVEAVADLLSRHNGLVIDRDEIAGWIESFDAYRKGGDRQQYLSSWAFAPWKADRKTTGSIYVPHPIVCIAGGIQPDRLPALRDGIADDGFPDRLLCSFPDACAVGYIEAEDDEEAIKEAVAIFTRLHNLKAGTEPVVMTDQAHAMFKRYMNDNARMLASGAVTGLAAGWASKAPSHLARLALVLHALGEVDPTDSLTVETMDAAIRLTDYFRSHFLRCLPHMGAFGVSLPAGDAARVRRRLLEAGGLWVARSAIMQKTRLDAARLTAALGELEAAGEAEHRDEGTRTNSREEWRIAPPRDAGLQQIQGIQGIRRATPSAPESSEFAEFAEGPSFASADPPTPYGLFGALCEAAGTDPKLIKGTVLERQLAVAKRLVAAGATNEDVARCHSWLRSQSWVEGSIDMTLIEGQWAKWVLAGKPMKAAAAPTARPGSRATNLPTGRVVLT